MSRRKKCRRICAEPRYWQFESIDSGSLEKVVLTVDEYEVIRLLDYEKLTQEECAKRMDIARTTVTEMYDRARSKIADGIVNGKKLQIAGGNYMVYGEQDLSGNNEECRTTYSKRKREGGCQMKIALPCMGTEIWQHFGHCENFMVYDVENGKIIREESVANPGHRPGFLPNFLADMGVEVVIAGGMGGGAVDIFNERQVEVVVGASGDAKKAVISYLNGELQTTGEVCHEHEHADECH